MEPGDFDFERDNFPQLLENDMWELARSYARDYLSLVNDKQGGVDFLKSEKLELLKSDAYTFHVSQVEVWAVTLSTLKEEERVVSRYIESFDRGRNIESFLSFVPLLKSYVDGFAAQLKIEGLTRLIELEERPHTPTAKPGNKGKEKAPAELPTLESIYDGDLMELWQNISGMDNPLVSAKGDYIPKSKKRVSEVSALAQALIVLGKTKGHSFDDVCRALFVFWKEDAPKRIRPGGYAFDDALSYFTKMIK